MTADLAFGAGFYVPVQDPFALSRGNTFVGDASSPAAVYYNPAGLTQLEKPELQLGVYSIDIMHEADVGGDSYDADRKWQTFPQFYYARPISEKVSAGIGLNTPFGLGTKWGMDTPFRTVTTNAELTYATLWSVIALELNSQFSIGTGIGIHYADAVLEQGLGIFPNDEFTFDGDDTGVSWLISAHWKPNQQHSFGLIYRSRTDFNLSGTAETQNTGGFFPIGSPESATFDFVTPATAALGYTYVLNEDWTLAADIEWINFSQLKESAVLTESQEVPFAFNWENAYIFGAGASYRFEGSEYKLAFGYTFVGNSVPDETFNPAINDADRHWVTYGFGRDSLKYKWFLGYQYAFSDRSVTDSSNTLAGENANGEFSMNAHSLSFSFSKQF